MGRPGGAWRSNRPARVQWRRTRASWKSVQIGRSTALAWKGPQLYLSQPLRLGALRPGLGREGGGGATRWCLALKSACEGPVAAYAGALKIRSDRPLNGPGLEGPPTRPIRTLAFGRPAPWVGPGGAGWGDLVVLGAGIGL
jgi:hypothetical protein